jgi:hypothetical protein
MPQTDGRHRFTGYWLVNAYGTPVSKQVDSWEEKGGIHDGIVVRFLVWLLPKKTTVDPRCISDTDRVFGQLTLAQ